MTSQEVFDADLARFTAEIERRGAVGTYDDGDQYIIPGILSAEFIEGYSRLLSYGYANGLLP